MHHEVWTKEKLWLLKTYVDNGFSEQHMQFMLNVDDEQLKEGISRLNAPAGDRREQ